MKDDILENEYMLNGHKNHNILDSIPVIKKHPYITLCVLCLTLNFTTHQNSNMLVQPLLMSLLFGFISVVVFEYLSKSTNDFVFSPRGMLFIVPIFLAIIICGTMFNDEKNGIFTGSVFFFALLLVVLLLLKFTGRLTWQNSLLLIFITGFAIRTIYAMYTQIAETSVRQHDVWSFMSKTSPGLLTTLNNKRHAEYIEYIARYLMLPDIDPSGGLSQLYHPPLHHILSGLLLRLNVEIGMDYKSACEGIQYLTVFYSSSCMITGYKIFKELGLKGKSLLRATALVSLFPWFYLFAGSVNNDILSVALGFAAILFAIKWYKNPSIQNIMLISVTLGLAMFTKLSMGLLAPGIAFLFLIKFISVCRKKDNIVNTKNGEKTIGIGYIMGSFASFGAVVFPLGIGWQVRNMIKWGMPLSYVPSLSKTADQYLGDRSVFERFFGFDESVLTNPFVAWGDKGADYYEYNIFKGGFKTALFGETGFFSLGKGETPMAVIISTIGSFFCIMLALFFLALIVLSLISLFIFIRKKLFGIDKNIIFFLSIIFVTFFGNYILFCFNYPFTCTMNFRYMIPCLLLPILTFSVATGAETKECHGAQRVFNTVSTVVSKGFLVCGAVVYVLFSIVQ